MINRVHAEEQRNAELAKESKLGTQDFDYYFPEFTKEKLSDQKHYKYEQEICSICIDVLENGEKLR